LLTELLRNAVSEVSAPATFRLIIARAFVDDAAAFESLDHFAEALAPFAAPDPPAVIAGLVSSWQIRKGPLDPLPDFAAHARVAPLPATQPVAAPVELRSVVEPRSRRLVAAAVIGLLLALLPAVWLLRSRTADDPAPSTASVEDQTRPRPVEPQPQSPAPEIAAPARLRQGYGGQAPAPALAPARSAETPARSAALVLANSAFSPAFASATSGMFYHSGTGPGSAIMRAETDSRGGVLHVTSVVSDRGANFHPRPSPDGRSIAFDSDRDGERGVYVADANGTGVRRVSGGGFAAIPSWSPDGRRLAMVRAENGRPRVWNLWTVDMASGTSTRITSHKYGQPWGAAWFPEGDRIAYSHETRLIVRTLDGKQVRTFNTPVRGRLVRTPAVSPDGKWIIFQVRRDGAWLLDLASGAMHRVLEDPTAEEFTWSPDGRRVAYHSRRSGGWGVWVMAPR
jgi:WD40 repeat protein